MKKGDLIFVYGTLRRGERADLQKQAHSFGVSYLFNDKINGMMYHLGAYPGVKLIRPLSPFNPLFPTVCGEVFIIREAAMIAIMDAYECYDIDNPSMGLYDRSEVETEKGKTVWVYEFNDRVTPDQLIEGGDWCKSPSILVRNKRLRL